MKNINDLLTIITLFILLYFSLRVFLFAVIGNDTKIPGFNRLELLKQYRENEEE